MTSRPWAARLALIIILTIVSIVTGCTPAPIPPAPTTAKARTPLVVIPASSKTYSDRGVVAWKVYPYLSGKTGGFTIVGVDTKSNVKRVTRVFDVAGKVKGAPPMLVYAAVYPKSSARSMLGNTGLVWATMGSSTRARHLGDVTADATSYLPKASSQGNACSTSVKRVMSCLSAPALGDLGARWTQVRTCRLAMAHLVKPATCIQHSVKLKVPSGSSTSVKDGDDDDGLTPSDPAEDDATQDAEQDEQDEQDQPAAQEDTQPAQDQQQQDATQDAAQDAQDDAQPTGDDTSGGDFTAGTNEDPQTDANTQAADEQPTDANGLGTNEATAAQGVAPIPTAGETQTGASQDSATTGGCGASTESLHVLTAGVCTAPTANATPIPTADQGAFGATASQATCSSGCEATLAAGTANTNDPQVQVPTSAGATAQGSASLAGLTVNVGVTSVASDPDHVYLSVGGGVTTQLAGAGVAAGPIVVRGDPQDVLTGKSVVSDVGGAVGVAGAQVEVQKNQSGTTVAVMGTAGPGLVPVTVTAGMSYGWRIPVQNCTQTDFEQGSCMSEPPF